MAVVLLERPSKHIALIRLNRPEAKNALNTELRALLSQYFLELNNEPAIRCIVITGNAEVFAAGADLKEIVDSIKSKYNAEQDEEEYIMSYMTEQVKKDKLTNTNGDFVERGFKKPKNYWHWTQLNG